MTAKTIPYQRRSQPRGRPRKANREAVRFIDEWGVEAVRVPLDDEGRCFALADAWDYDRLKEGGVTGAWYGFTNGHQTQEYVRTSINGIPGRKITVARAILGVGRREVVRYNNRDTLDLRRLNLSASRGRAKRNDQQLVEDARNA
ncbi:hypothetical protein G6N74_04275 [Mesorhizobium sp. CGMCC 1.15528]|uniref:Uncharacterized protein n=1 Tax=Mesorhizobium zhangyense TaxID=1776730 RepID=A0A7C9VA42_9HYPH|nr:hypothetical protein [Mesorhizobium zhangyense]NGN40270.1 hypothetical protein [Mesorhizobium zhangyense]